MARAKRHIRRDVPPWVRPTLYTECGRKSTTSWVLLTREEWLAIAKAAGLPANLKMFMFSSGRLKTFIQEQAMCQTCLDKAGNWKPWEENPMVSMGRWIEWAHEHKDINVAREARAVLAVFEELSLRDEFPVLVTRTKALLALSTGFGSPR